MSTLTKKGVDFTEKLERTKIQLDQGLIERAESFLSSATLPTTRDEAWKYTRLAKLNKVAFTRGDITNVSAAKYHIDTEALQIFVVNGKVITDLKTIQIEDGLSIDLLSDKNTVLSETQNAIDSELFSAINLVYLNDGIEIKVADEAVIGKTIEIIHVLSGKEQMANFKTHIRCGKFAQLNVILGYFSAEDCNNSFLNHTLEVEAGENALINIDKLQFENETCYHVSNETVEQEKDSTFSICSITLNGLLVRNNLTILVNGENATTNLYGAYLLKGNQHCDNHTVVDHRVGHCQSNELYKGVIDDHATGVFNGKVFVRPDAQKINAFQSNANVLMSDDSSIYSKPELEIYADDVKCSHGSTTGQLDEEAVFYLRSRGLSEESARKLLISAFIEDVLKEISNEPMHAYVRECMTQLFGF